MIRGELDCVVMKALEKYRTLSYETANGQERDIDRYLADECGRKPWPASAGYRLRANSRGRNRTALINGGADASGRCRRARGGAGGPARGQPLARGQERRPRPVQHQPPRGDPAKGRGQHGPGGGQRPGAGPDSSWPGRGNPVVQGGGRRGGVLKENRLRPLRDKLLGLLARRFCRDRLGNLLRGQIDSASKAVLAESYADLGELIDRIGQKPEALEAYKKAVAIRRELAVQPWASASERVKSSHAPSGLGEERLSPR